MDAEGGDFEQVEAAVVAALERKKEDYGARAIRSPILWVIGGALAGGARGHFLVGLVGGAVIGSLWALYYVRLSARDPRAAPVLALLRTRAQEIVWIYPQREHREASAAIVLGLADGTREEVPIVADPAERDRILEAIAARVPWATVGFHHEHERRYFAQPESLRREVGARQGTT